MPRHWPWVLFFAVCGIGWGIRWLNVGAVPGWYTDEGVHLSLAQGLLSGQIRNLAIVDSSLLFARPPLFHLILTPWVAVLGETLGAVRALTGVLGVCAVALLLLRGVSDAGDRGLWFAAGVVLAVWPSAVVLSRFGFSYNLLAPFGVAMAVGLIDAQDHQDVRGLHLSALVLGLALLSDVWAGGWLLAWGVAVLIGPQRQLAVRAAPQLVALIAGPVAAYAVVMLVLAPDAFIYDLRFTLGRLGAIPLGEQPGVVLDNLTQITWQAPVLVVGGIGLLVSPTPTLRRVLGLMFWVPVLVLARTTALYSLGSYYLIPLLPLAAIGLAVLAWRTGRWLGDLRRIRQAVLVTLVAICVGVIGLDLRWALTTWPTVFDPFLVPARDGYAVQAWLRAQARAEDIIVTSSSLAWGMPGRPVDVQMAIAAEGIGTPHLPADLPAERFAFDARWRCARYIVVDPLWTAWAAIHVPSVADRLEALSARPPVFQSGAISVYDQAERSSCNGVVSQ